MLFVPSAIDMCTIHNHSMSGSTGHGASSCSDDGTTRPLYPDQKRSMFDNPRQEGLENSVATRVRVDYSLLYCVFRGPAAACKSGNPEPVSPFAFVRLNPVSVVCVILCSSGPST